MSDTPDTPAGVAAPLRTPLRRLRLFAVCLAAAATAAVLSAGQAYYTMHVDGVSAVDGSMRTVDGISVTASVTGRELVAQSAHAPTIGPGSAVANTRVPSAMAGLPAPVALLVVAAIAGIVGAALSSSLASILACGFVLFAYRALSQLTAIVENPTAGGQFVTRAVGLQLLQIALMATAVLTVSTAVQVVMLARQRRRERRERALAEGREPEPTTLDWIRGAASLGTSVVAEHARKQAASGAGATPPAKAAPRRPGAP